MASIIKLNSVGVQEVLKSAEMQAELRRRAEMIAAVAGAGMEVEVSVGRTRARATVRTATRLAMIAEATRRTLTRALGAGRG